MITVICSDKSSVQLNRAALLHIFPESILAQAFRDDPEAKEVTVSHPCVTQDVLKVIQQLLEGQLPPTETKIPAEAGKYLNMPILDLICFPTYPDVFAAYNYREKKWKYGRQPYKKCLGAGHRLKLAELFRYGLCLMPEDAPTEYIDFLKDKVL